MIKTRPDTPVYFTGKRCRNRHLAPRYRCNDCCVQCCRINNARGLAKVRAKREMLRMKELAA